MPSAHQRGALVVDEVLGQRVVAGVRRAEHDAVGERERLAGQLAVAAPLLVVGEVGGVVVGDGVELGEHDAAAEAAEQQQVARRGHLVGPVDDVARLGGLVGLVVPHALDAHAVERLAGAVAERARDGDAQPHVAAARQRAGQLESEHLRAGQRRARGTSRRSSPTARRPRAAPPRASARAAIVSDVAAS